ncbi:hypothetical protein [Plebeiibacterium sediminum]|uniref:Uncharacterized protein n=1 Tax=Plebeiibacterium sediminum TaxID=2992112 RepID=A0AAE3SD74_9BACT|nr:hypothetical protein [Plebeiobacterium sediminum]MCW3784903.1 hypothetical protein [Plebeiobacterium sediminum]
MKKNLIIVGPIASGKTTLANHIKAQYKNPITLIFKGYDQSGFPPFYFNNCNEDTDLVIIECETNNAIHIETIIRRCVYPINVEKRGNSPFQIDPKIIFTTQELPSDLNLKSTTQYYDFVFLTNNNPFNN